MHKVYRCLGCFVHGLLADVCSCMHAAPSEGLQPTHLFAHDQASGLYILRLRATKRCCLASSPLRSLIDKKNERRYDDCLKYTMVAGKKALKQARPTVVSILCRSAVSSVCWRFFRGAYNQPPCSAALLAYICDVLHFTACVCSNGGAFSTHH